MVSLLHRKDIMNKQHFSETAERHTTHLGSPFGICCVRSDLITRAVSSLRPSWSSTGFPTVASQMTPEACRQGVRMVASPYSLSPSVWSSETDFLWKWKLDLGYHSFQRWLSVLLSLSLPPSFVCVCVKRENWAKFAPSPAFTSWASYTTQSVAGKRGGLFHPAPSCSLRLLSSKVPWAMAVSFHRLLGVLGEGGERSAFLWFTGCSPKMT